MTEFESGIGDTRDSLLEELPDRVQTGRPTSTRRRRWLTVAPLAVVLAGALAVLALAPWTGPASATSVGPIAWKAPEAIDTSAPYTNPDAIRSVSCGSATSCVADTGFGGIVSSSDPTGTSTADWSTVSPSSLVASGASPYSLATVSCVGSFCATGGFNVNSGANGSGAILTSSDPTGGSASDWKAASLSDPIEIWFIQCQSSSSCIALDAYGYVLTYNGSSWSRSSSSLIPNEDYNISGLSCPSASLCLASDYGGDVFISQDPTDLSTAWTEQTSSTTGAAGAGGGISCASTSDCALFGSGDNGAVYTTDASSSTPTWTVGSANSALDEGVNTGTCLTATSDCLLGGGDSSLFGSTNGGQSFSSDSSYPHSIGGPLRFGCAGSSLCLAGTANGYVSDSTDPSQASSSTWSSGLLVARGFDSAQFGPDSCPSSTLCVATDTEGRVLTGRPAAFSSKLLSGAGSLGAAICPSTSLCVATNGFDIFSSTDPAGGGSSWRETATNPTHGVYIDSLQCPSASLCVGIDGFDDIISSTDPAGGSWHVGTTPVTNSSYQPVALTCPSSSLCVGLAEDYPSYYSTGTGSYEFHSTTPSTVNSGWSGGGSPVDKGYLNGLVCPSSSLCAAYDGTGHVLSSTDPASGSWSAPSALSGGAVLQNLACPSSSLCVGYGAKGNPITSTDPAGGASHWTVSSTSIDANQINNLTCPSASLCLLGDSKGNVVESTKPAGGASAWTTIAIDPGHSLQSLTCDRTSLCVASDNAGNAVEGTPNVSTTGTGSAAKAKVRSAKLSDKLKCAGSSGQKCTFKLRLTAKAKTIGSKTVTVVAGQHKTVTLSLNRTGKKLLRKHRTLRAVFTVKQGTHTLRRQTLRFRRT